MLFLLTYEKDADIVGQTMEVTCSVTFPDMVSLNKWVTEFKAWAGQDIIRNERVTKKPLPL